MNDSSDSIRTFLAKSPSLSEILAFVEEQAQRIAAERKKAAQAGQGVTS